jgi:hypothetical protein
MNIRIWSIPYTHIANPRKLGQISPKKAAIPPNAPDPPPYKTPHRPRNLRVKEPTANAKKASTACKFPSGPGPSPSQIHPSMQFVYR